MNVEARTPYVFLGEGIKTRMLQEVCRCSKPTAKSHVTIAGGPGGISKNERIILVRYLLALVDSMPET